MQIIYDDSDIKEGIKKKDECVLGGISRKVSQKIFPVGVSVQLHHHHCPQMAFRR